MSVCAYAWIYIYIYIHVIIDNYDIYICVCVYTHLILFFFELGFARPLMPRSLTNDKEKALSSYPKLRQT